MQNYTKKGKKEYAMLQIQAETYKMLKEHCDRNGYAMSKLITIMVKNVVSQSIQKELIK